LRNYDSHLILKTAYALNSKDISAIPNNCEKFLTFQINKLKFVDSIQFLNSSLEKLVENLKDNEPELNNFPIMKSTFPCNAELLCQKGVYPYEWVDDISKLDHKGLPPKEAFYSTLKQATTSDEKYEHAWKVYKEMNCKTFKDYHMYCLKTDVALLADVFENFRKKSLSAYGLDPANFITAPSLAWDAMLLKTGVKLELLHDERILDNIERHKRGGLCFVGSKRFAKANNRYMDGFNENEPESYMLHLDANNLYGWAVSEPLPYGNFKFSDASLEDVLNTDDNNEAGYILDVDLSFPAFPPCPESIAPKEEWLSDWQVAAAKEHRVKVGKQEKRTPHLHDHKNPVIHFRNLKYVVQKLGVKIDKVHSVISFSQSKWLEPYMKMNTDEERS
jgi:hypothetical protein